LTLRDGYSSKQKKQEEGNQHSKGFTFNSCGTNQKGKNVVEKKPQGVFGRGLSWKAGAEGLDGSISARVQRKEQEENAKGGITRKG